MALQCGIVGLPNVGKINTFQLSVKRKSAGSKLSFLYNRTECRCNHRTR